MLTDCDSDRSMTGSIVDVTNCRAFAMRVRERTGGELTYIHMLMMKSWRGRNFEQHGKRGWPNGTKQTNDIFNSTPTMSASIVACEISTGGGMAMSLEAPSTVLTYSAMRDRI